MALMRIPVALFLILIGSPLAAATGCEDVWFTRNLIMDRAGYCFASPLGQALFDNSDCVGTHVQPASPDQAVVDQILALEAQFGCRVDTNRTWLDLSDINFRRALTNHPVKDEFEWGCLGWTGPVTPLHAGYHAPLRAIGQISPGDYVSFAYLSDAPGWMYVTTHAPVWGALKSAGWLYWPENQPCAAEAG